VVFPYCGARVGRQSADAQVLLQRSRDSPATLADCPFAEQGRSTGEPGTADGSDGLVEVR